MESGLFPIFSRDFLTPPIAAWKQMTRRNVETSD
jgi:hypothetical protein